MREAPKEKTLKVRKRKKASKGRVIRVSDLVFNHLDKRRLNNSKQSHDSFLRKQLGLPARSKEAEWIKLGRPNLLMEGFVEQHSEKFYFDEADANGEAVMQAARRKTKVKKPIFVREVR